MKPNVAVVVPELVTVTIDATVCEPCVVVGNATDFELKDNAAVAMPVPDSAVLPFPALEVTPNEPESAPVAFGKNDTIASNCCSRADLRCRSRAPRKKLGSFQ